MRGKNKELEHYQVLKEDMNNSEMASESSEEAASSYC